jgi:hypothetical protein
MSWDDLETTERAFLQFFIQTGEKVTKFENGISLEAVAGQISIDLAVP